MPPMNILRLRAAHHNLSFSSEVSVKTKRKSAQSTVELTRCFHCHRIIPFESSRSRHIAATPECRLAEMRDIRFGRWTAALPRRTLRPADCDPAEDEPTSTLDAPYLTTGTSCVAFSTTCLATRPPCLATHPPRLAVRPPASQPVLPASQSSPPTSQPAPTLDWIQPASKRRKVTVETIPDEDAPWADVFQSAVPTVPSASGTSSGLGARDSSVFDNSEPDVGPAKPRSAQPRLRRWKGMYVEGFPDPLAGAPVSDEKRPTPDMDAYMHSVHPMNNPKVFEGAELLMTSQMTDAAKERHLKSSIYAAQTPWSGCGEMLTDVDRLPHGPDCELLEIDVFDGTRSRVQYLVRRSVVDVVRDLVGNRALHGHFKYTPVRMYTSARNGKRVYSEMWTANWWWEEQMKLQHKGAVTIVPLILATDQTMLSIMCGGQAAYPVYLTLGNISKDWRRKPSKRTMVLLGYLPVEAFEDVEDDDERRRMKADLVHRSMEKMLEPLKVASEEGVEMWCPDGRLCRIYPRIAAHLADWPEQNLMSCTSIGSCPICSTKRAGRGDIDNQAPLRDRDETLGAILSYFKTRDIRELQGLSLKPVWPWWGDLPHVNLATCITPDLLHQLYQGIFKTHLVRWLKHLVGADELDERFAAMPNAEGLQHFSKGISIVKQWTGRESKEMVAQILPVFLGDVTPELTQLLRSVVDFIFRAHASSMTETDLADMEHDLELFHELKGLLVVRGFYESDSRFDLIPKLHMLSHYAHSIRALGTPDGYNTEAPEHLHIEYAKVPWRASNKVRPLEQMLKYIQRQEAVRIHRANLNLYLGVEPNGEDNEDDLPGDEEMVSEEGFIGGKGACRGFVQSCQDPLSLMT